MHYVCARCHFELTAPAQGEGEGESGSELACPRCKAEAGLEPVHGIPVAMKLFGMLLAGVAVLAVGGGLVSRLLG